MLEQNKSENERRVMHKEKKAENFGLNDLEERGVLGRGAFGFVFLVRNKINDERYAMKKLLKTTVVEKKQEQNVLREKALLSSMNHPFVVQLHLASQDDD